MDVSQCFVLNAIQVSCDENLGVWPALRQTEVEKVSDADLVCQRGYAGVVAYFVDFWVLDWQDSIVCQTPLALLYPELLELDCWLHLYRGHRICERHFEIKPEVLLVFAWFEPALELLIIIQFDRDAVRTDEGHKLVQCVFLSSTMQIIKAYPLAE